MNKKQLQEKLTVVYQSLLYEKGFITPVDVFIKLGYLKQKDYEEWRFGKYPCLEKLIHNTNLSSINYILRSVNNYGINKNLKPSWTDYRMWGKNKGQPLKFSRSGDPNIEKAYATHYINMLLKKKNNTTSEDEKQ